MRGVFKPAETLHHINEINNYYITLADFRLVDASAGLDTTNNYFWVLCNKRPKINFLHRKLEILRSNLIG